MKTHETNLQILLNFKGWCYLSMICRNNIIYKISDREGVVHLKFGGMEWFIWDLLAGGRGWGWLIWDLCDFTENYTLSRDGGNLFEISSYFRLKIAQSKQIQGGRWFVIRLKPPHLPSQNLQKKDSCESSTKVELSSVNFECKKCMPRRLKVTEYCERLLRLSGQP